MGTRAQSSGARRASVWRRLAVAVVGGGAFLASALPAAAAAGIQNGDFTNGLTGWTPVAVSQGSYPGYPHIEASTQPRCYPTETGNQFAYLDVPGNAEAYLQQEISIPLAHPHLTLLTWGNLTPVTATIALVAADGTTHVLSAYTPPTLQASPSTCSGAKPEWFSFDLSAYAGTQLELRFEATSSGYDGTIADFDDVAFTGTLPAGAVASGTAATNPPTSVATPTTLATPTTVPVSHTTTPTVASSSRSTIASSLVPIDHAFPLSWRSAVNVAITLAAMLLITFPAQLFNKTLDENYDQVRDVIRRRAPLLVSLRRALLRVRESSGLAAFAGVMVVGSILGGLNDPTFGFNTKSVETFVAVICSFMVGVTVSSMIARLYRRRKGVDTSWRWHARPGGLLVAATCMIVSRTVGFEPGYLYGVIAGVAFTTALGEREQGHNVALGTVATLVLAVVSWAIWTPLATEAAKPHPVFILVIADTFFAGLFVSGVVGTVINLMPLRFLPGSSLARWHKGVWAAVMAVAVFLLVEVMLLPAASGARHGNAPIVTTIVLFGIFGGLSVGFHRYFAVRVAKATANADEVPDEVPDEADIQEQDTVLGSSSEA